MNHRQEKAPDPQRRIPVLHHVSDPNPARLLGFGSQCDGRPGQLVPQGPKGYLTLTLT